VTKGNLAVKNFSCIASFFFFLLININLHYFENVANRSFLNSEIYEMKSCVILSLAILFSVKIAGQQSGYIMHDSSKLYYESRGTGSAILFLHGGYLEHSMWAKQVDFFSKKYRVVTIDLPGHGKTCMQDSLMLIAEVIRLCLDSLHISHTSLVGLSLGATCAVDFVLAYPGRVDKLVLVSPGLSGGPDVIKMDSITLRAFASADSATQSKDIKKFASVFAANWCIGPFRKPEDVNAVLRDYVYEQVLFTIEHHREDTWPLFQRNPLAAKMIGSIKSKVLVITADKDIPYIDSVCHYFVSKIKGAKMAKFYNAAHLINLEQPDKFNSVVAEFLKD
jgi:3-oxoadipate enol-lactonase